MSLTLPQRIADQARSALRSPHYWPLFVVLFGWGGFFVTLLVNTFDIRPDGVWIAHENLWSDWSLHIAMANIFALKDPSNWFAHHPHYAYGKFTYGFMTNAISGLLMRAGWNLVDAFIVPSILYVAVLLTALYSVAYTLVKHRWWAVVAVSLFFLTSGLGWWHVWQATLAEPGHVFFWRPPHNYSFFPEYDWYAGNVIVGLLWPQRAFLLGFTVAMSALAIVLRAVVTQPSARSQWLRGVSAGLLAGVLPITHMHSFLALIAVSGPVTLWQWRTHWRFLVSYGVVAGALSTLLFGRFVAGGIESDSFFTLLLGWTADSVPQWWQMWATLWGPVLPIAAVGLGVAWRRLDRVRALVLMSFIGIFVVANVVLFQPIRWDNSKLFAWSLFGMSCLMVIVLRVLWERGAWRWLQRSVVVVMLAMLTFGGWLDLRYLLDFPIHTYMMTSAEDMSLNWQIQLETDENAVFATHPAHNHPVSMWGVRPIMMGYTAWVHNFGFMYAPREQALRSILSGDADALDMIVQYRVSYVYWGPGERQMTESSSPTWYNDQFPIAFENESTRVYDVRSLWADIPVFE